VPLSDHEQRLLEQIEQALYDDDPKFARLYQTTDVRSHYRSRVVRAVAGFILGLGLLLAAVIVPLIPLGILGFLVMLASVTFAIHSWQRMVGRKVGIVSNDEPRVRRRAAQREGGRGNEPRRSVVKRLEERWQRRQDEGR
jgi:Protein of unknown function (DUF3040)